MDTNWQAPSFIRPDEQTIIHADIDTRNAGWVYPPTSRSSATTESLADLAEALPTTTSRTTGHSTGPPKRRRRSTRRV